MTKEELKNKYSAFITEISEILGLGKPIDILKLCATTDLFFQPLKKQIVALEKENAELKKDRDYFSDALDKQVEATLELLKKYQDLEAQIEKMKCCHNCKNCAYAGFEIICRTYDCINNSKWEIKENE